MKYAADFRQEARAALQGKWPLAILVGLVAAILGGAASGGPEFKINFTGGSLNANIQYAGQTIYSWGDGITPGLRAVLVGGAIYLILAAIVLGVLYFILGSVIEVGYARFNLNLTAGEKPPFETLFSYFPYWKTIAVTMLLQAVYIFLWTLLLIIPGIMVALDALSSRTAQLPRIGLELPRRMIGANTEDCMKSGILYGNAAMIDGIIALASRELGDIPTVIAAGGLAKIIVPLCEQPIILDDDLTLKGLRILYEKNRSLR